MTESFDIIVLGSGIAGSQLALVLQQAGLKTLCVERKTHPRFAIGESTVPTTSFLLKQMATDYNVPELAQIAHYLGLREIGCPAWPKQGFWHGSHREGERLAVTSEQFLETLHLPIGPDVHVMRAHADAYLVAAFAKYGVSYEDNTEMVDFEATPSGIRVKLVGPAGERTVGAHLLVDASGHASFLANRFGLRDAEPRLATNTRSIFSHFKNVPPLDERLGGCNPSFRFRRDAATMHHQFRGGWIWVIPFDTGVTSVGIELDRSLYPLDESISPQDEIAKLFERYPTIADHLSAMEPVRPIVRTDRIQFTASSILGNGFILTPHAAGFVEPLYSTGILLTSLFISRFVPLALEAKASGNWQPEQFRVIEQSFFDELRQVDMVVDGSIKTFHHAELFKQFWRNWTIGIVAHLADCVLVGRAPRRAIMLGAGLPEFSAHLARMYTAIRACRTDADADALAVRMHHETQPWWDRIAAPLMSCAHAAPGADGASASYANRDVQQNLDWLEKMRDQPETSRPDMSFKQATRWMSHAARSQSDQLERYARSRAEGSDYHVAYERILGQHNRPRFDYHDEVGMR
jgi:FADH2 O2-dependent halogenase